MTSGKITTEMLRVAVMGLGLSKKKTIIENTHF
jgi:hypothetical protein